MILNFELFAVVFIDLLDLLLPDLESLVELLEKVSQVAHLLFLEHINFVDLLLGLLLNHRVLACLTLHSHSYSLEFLLHLKSCTLIGEDEIVLGVINHTVRAETPAILSAVVLDSLLGMDFATHVLH